MDFCYQMIVMVDGFFGFLKISTMYVSWVGFAMRAIFYSVL